jgi:hypothetical protein
MGNSSADERAARQSECRREGHKAACKLVQQPAAESGASERAKRNNQVKTRQAIERVRPGQASGSGGARPTRRRQPKEEETWAGEASRAAAQCGGEAAWCGELEWMVNWGGRRPAGSTDWATDTIPATARYRFGTGRELEARETGAVGGPEAQAVVPPLFSFFF